MLERAKICTGLIFLVFICTPIMTHGLEAGTGAGMISIDKNTYHLERHDMTYVNIDGQSYLEKRQEITIIVTYPNEHTEIRRVQSTDDGIFKDILILDKDSQPGTYYIEGKGENGILGRIDFRVIPLRDPPVVEREIPKLILPNLIINTNKQSYSEGDTIIVNGAVTGSSLYSAGLKIFSPSRQIHAEQIIVNRDGTFSTSIKTTGSAWSQNGEYTIDVGYADRTEKITFSFVSTSQNTSHQQIQKNDNIGKVWDETSEFYYMHEQIIHIIMAVIVIGGGGYAVKKYRSSKSGQTKNTDCASSTNDATNFLFGSNTRSTTTSTDSNAAYASSKPAKKDTVIPPDPLKNIPKQKIIPKDTTRTPYTAPVTAKKSQNIDQNIDGIKQNASINYKEKYVLIPDSNVLIKYNKNKLEGIREFYDNDNRIFVMPIVKNETRNALENMNKKDSINDKDRPSSNNVIKLKKQYPDIAMAEQKKLMVDIDKMFKDITLDPDMEQQRLRWHYIKNHDLLPKYPYAVEMDGRNAEKDKAILASASYLANTNKDIIIILLTFDYDFIIFPFRIRKQFNVHILNGYWYLKNRHEYDEPIDEIIGMNQKDLLEKYDVLDDSGNAKVYGKIGGYKNNELLRKFGIEYTNGIQINDKKQLIFLMDEFDGENNKKITSNRMTFDDQVTDEQHLSKNIQVLIDSKEKKYRVIFFGKLKKTVYLYFVEYISHEFLEQKNNDGSSRKTIRFTLKLL